MTKSERKRHHFNYFTVDFDEELSAFSGEFLVKQTLFMEHAIQRIFKCYTKAANKPPSLIAIGHSMGGIVLRGLISSPTFDYRKISTIVTLATPHRQPTVNIDPVLYHYYENVNKAWLENQEKFENITFLSLGGGFRDFLVRSDLCLMHHVANETKNHFSRITSSLPNIWLSNDHQCISWCNELVRALTRMFFKMVNPKTSQIYHSPKIRAKILKKVFLHPDLTSANTKVRLNLKDSDRSSCTLLKIVESIVINDDSQCYELDIKEGDLVEFWFHSVTGLLMKLFACDSKSKCNAVLFTKNIPGGSKFVSVRGRKGTRYYLMESNKAEIFIAKHREDNFEISLPSVVAKTERLSLYSPRFFLEVSLSGLSSTWKCYNLRVSSDSECHRSSSAQCMVVIEVENEVTGELYVSQSKPDASSNIVDMKLKFFTPSPAKKNIKLRVWSKSMFSNLQIDLNADVKCFLGQIVRFNHDSLIRYTLVIYLLNRELGFLKRFTLLFFILKTVFNCTASARKNSLSLFDLFVDSMVVESCVISMALSLAMLLAFGIQLLVYLIEKILFVGYFRSTLKSNTNTVNNVFCSMFIIYSGYLYRVLGAHAVLISCMVVDLFRDMLKGNIDSSVTFLPISLFSTLVPIVLTVKNIMNGHPVVDINSINPNVKHLTWCYILYLIYSIIGGKDLLNLGLFSGRVNRAILAITCLTFMLGEVLNLYNLCYLVVACMVLRVL